MTVYRRICLLCGTLYESDNQIYKSYQKYCYACRIRIQNRHDKSVDVVIEKKGQSKLITDNIDYYNAGLFAGKQGYLRERFYELFAGLDDFLLVMSGLDSDPKWQAELKGLGENQRRAWLIAFMVSINNQKKGELA